MKKTQLIAADVKSESESFIQTQLQNKAEGVCPDEVVALAKVRRAMTGCGRFDALDEARTMLSPGSEPE